MKAKIVLILASSILILLTVSIIESFNHSRSDEPVKADVIIMLAGGDSGRMEKAADLYHQGYAEYIIISPLIEEYYPQSKEFVLELGIPDSAILEEKNATSTYTNATLTLKMLQEYNMKTALVVTSDYHLKRSKMIFDRVNKGEFKLTYIAALSPNNERWYDRTHANQLWFKELYKLWGYRFGLYNFFDY